MVGRNVSVMKDGKTKLVEIESSHTLGGTGGKVVSRGEGSQDLI